MNRLLVALSTFLVICSPALAGGLDRPGGIGPKALGMGGAYTAIFKGDISSFYFNVAALSEVEGYFRQQGIEAGLTRLDLKLSRDFIGFSGVSESKPAMVPFYVQAKRLTKKLVYGEALYASPVLTFTQAFAYQLTDTLSIGVGLDVNSAMILQMSVFQNGKNTFDEVAIENEADGYGFGFRLGMLWQPTDYFSWGLAYTSTSKIKLSGRSKIEVFNLVLFRDGFDAEFTLPSKISMGIALKPTSKLILALDAFYYDYSKTERELEFDFDLLPTMPFPLAWKDSYGFRAGVQWHPKENWFLRTGAGWQSSSVPEEEINSLFGPDDDTWHIGFGIGHTGKKFSIDLAYVLAGSSREYMEDKSIEAGVYKTRTHIVSIGIRVPF